MELDPLEGTGLVRFSKNCKFKTVWSCGIASKLNLISVFADSFVWNSFFIFYMLVCCLVRSASKVCFLLHYTLVWDSDPLFQSRHSIWGLKTTFALFALPVSPLCFTLWISCLFWKCQSHSSLSWKFLMLRCYANLDAELTVSVPHTDTPLKCCCTYYLYTVISKCASFEGFTYLLALASLFQLRLQYCIAEHNFVVFFGSSNHSIPCTHASYTSSCFQFFISSSFCGTVRQTGLWVCLCSSLGGIMAINRVTWVRFLVTQRQ